MLQCLSADARRMERSLYHSFINQEFFGDDKPVTDYFPIYWQTYFKLFGYKIETETAVDSHGSSLGHRFRHVISDLHEDFGKLHDTEFGVDKTATESYRTMAEDTFGDILPVRMCMGSLCAVPTQLIVHLMGMEQMYIAMADYPDEFEVLMSRAAADYIAFFKYLEHEGLLMPTVSCEPLGQGSFCLTDELPTSGAVTTNDVWGFMDSQETVGISPDMFREFIFPCYEKIAQHFGLLSYGCCEPVHPIWDCVKTLPNLRKVSISPWCDEEFMGERLVGSKTIYHRKPSPNLLSVDKELDEEAVKAHIVKTLRAAKGNALEITQRDVYTVHSNISKVKRYVEIIRQCLDEEWRQ